MKHASPSPPTGRLVTRSAAFVARDPLMALAVALLAAAAIGLPVACAHSRLGRLAVAAAPAWLLWGEAALVTLSAWRFQRHKAGTGIALRWSLRRLGVSLACLSLQAGAVAMAAIAVAAAAAVTGWVLHLQPRDATYLAHLVRVHAPLAAFQPAAKAAAVGAAALALWAGGSIWLLGRWSLACAITTFERVSPWRALRESSRRSRGGWLSVWVLQSLALTAVLAMAWIAGRSGRGTPPLVSGWTLGAVAIAVPYLGAMRALFYVDRSQHALRMSRKARQTAETFPGRY
jgi:hypothetical protein